MNKIESRAQEILQGNIRSRCQTNRDVLGGFGKSNSMLLHIINGEILLEEDITDDPKISTGEVNVHSLETRETCTLNVQDIVGRLESVFLSVEDETEIRQAGHGITVDGILTSPALLSANLGVQHRSNISWQRNERSASVNRGTSVLQLECLITKSHSLQFDFPVCLPANRGILDLASVKRVVNTAKDSRASIILGGTNAEGHDSIIDETLVLHFVKGGNHPVHGDGVICETHDTVELAESERQTGFFNGLCKVQVFDLEVPDGDVITGDETFHGASTVADLEGGAIRFIRRGLARIIFGMQEASDRSALG